MKILILGAAGMIGRKLAERLAADGTCAGETIAAMELVDVVAPTAPAGDVACKAHAFDITSDDPATLLDARPDVIFHLAAIVSGEAERDFDKGYAVNFDGTRALLDAIRAAHDADGYSPRVVFTSSIAVFGQPLPDTISDTHHLTPLTSYGTQKAMCELLLADHARRGHCEAISIRLPTIVVRPGKPNAAASGFFSSILREPLAGQPAVLPVSPDVRHWFASPRTAVSFLVHAAGVDLAGQGPHISLNMPGISGTVAEAIEALDRVAGEGTSDLISQEPDETIAAMIAGWPKGFDPQRSTAMGFAAESSFDEIIRVHLEDES